MAETTRSLEDQLAEFRQRRSVSTPIAGLFVWFAIGICGLIFESDFAKCMSIFVGTGAIFYVALGVARLIGEDLLGRDRPKNRFDSLFLLAVLQAVSVYSIAIPFLQIDATSLPLSVGILTGLMWIPYSWLLGHWVGIFHTSLRTVLILFLWYGFPESRFVFIPFAIVGVYAITIPILLRQTGKATPAIPG